MNISERYPALAKLAVLIADENAVEIPETAVLTALGEMIEADEGDAKDIEDWLANLPDKDFKAVAEVDETVLNKLIVTAPRNAEIFLTGVFNIGIDPARLGCDFLQQ